MLFISNYRTANTTSKSWLNFFKKISISSNLLIVLSCAYVALVLNAPFLLKAASVITSSDDYSLLFLLSVPLFLLSLFIFINSFMAICYLLKPVLIMTVLVLGETARAQNSSLNGYGTPTNQYFEYFFNFNH